MRWLTKFYDLRFKWTATAAIGIHPTKAWLSQQVNFKNAIWRLFSWAVWHSCRMGARNQEQTQGRIGPQLRLGNLRVGELHFCPLCTALDQASSLSRKLAYVPGPTFGFVKLLASSGSHGTKWADEQHRQAGFESRLLPDLPLPFIPTLISLRAFDLVSSRVWWEAATNTWHFRRTICNKILF